MHRNVSIVTLCLTTCLLASPCSAQSDPGFYKGKTVYMIVGSDAGGANDAYNKLIARHIGKYIPGEPSVVTQNMPGASGLSVLNYMANVAAKDGTMIGATQQSAPFMPLFEGRELKARFDPLRLAWIGSPNPFAAVAFAWHTAPVKTTSDLSTHELIVAEANHALVSSDAYLADNLLGFKYRVVLGYSGGVSEDLAIERGEVQGRVAAGWQGLKDRHDWLANKEINILYQVGQEKYDGISADVPLVLDFAKSPEDRAILDLKYASYSLGFPNFLPAETPADRVALLRSAFAAALRDPQLLQEAKQEKLDINPVSPEKIAAVLRKAYSATPEMVGRLLKLSQPPPSAK